jgi:hypothetical protein
MTGSHAIKVKDADMRRWEFLTPSGALTHLRIHAALATPERCEEVATTLRADNPGVEFKIVRVLDA